MEPLAGLSHSIRRLIYKAKRLQAACPPGGNQNIFAAQIDAYEEVQNLIRGLADLDKCARCGQVHRNPIGGWHHSSQFCPDSLDTVQFRCNGVTMELS